jgi:DNA replication protein DnaC
MNKEAEITLDYFKSFAGKEHSSGHKLPKDHEYSFLSNFKNPYSTDNPEFWVQIRDITKRIMTVDITQCPRYVFFCGSPGSGKSHLAAGIYHALLPDAVYKPGGNCSTTDFWTFSYLMNQISIEYAEVRIKESLEGCIREYIDWLIRWDFLFIDDFGANGRVFTQGTREYIAFQEIILTNWDREKTLITSTNLDGSVLLQELEKNFDEHIASRLKDSTIIQFPDDDLRGNKGA